MSTPALDIRPARRPGDRMNRTEAAWARQLDAQKLTYTFEATKFRLANNTWYTPDFVVFCPNGDGTYTIEVHEVKGFWRDDARVKWKTVAEQWPQFRFVAVGKRKAREGGGWWRETYGGKENGK